MIKRIRALLAREHGYSIVELLTVVTILSVVIGALTTLFVSASNGEVNMNRRFQAQENARLALDKLRREIHCATAVSPSGSSSITLTMSSQCPTTGGVASVPGGIKPIQWCVVAPPSVPSGRYALYRSTVAGACTSSSGVKWADYLRTQTIFTYTPQSPQSLGKLGVALVVRVNEGSTQGTFRLIDDIVLRNSTRT